MITAEMRDLAARWAASRGHDPDAWDQLDRLVLDDPAAAFRTIEEIHHLICSAEPRDLEAWGLLAAGPLENVLAEHGDSVIDLTEALARSDPEFCKLIAGVWQNSITDDVFARVQRVADPTYKFK